jgi:hypothetical protein
MELGGLPRMTVFNKIDLLDNPEQVLGNIGGEGLAISAVDAETLRGFLVQAELAIGKVLGDPSRPQVEP